MFLERVKTQMNDFPKGQLLSDIICFVTNSSDLITITDFIACEMVDYNDMIVQAKYNFLGAYYPWTIHIHKNMEKSKYFITLLSNEFPIFDVDTTTKTWQIANQYQEKCKHENILQSFITLYIDFDLDFEDIVRFHSNDLKSLSKTLLSFFNVHYDYPEIWKDNVKKECTVYILHKE